MIEWIVIEKKGDRVVMKNKTIAGQIRRLLFILGTGVLAALIVAAALVWRYDIASGYTLHDILLSPDTIQVLQERGEKGQKGSFPRFVFNGLSLRYYDTDAKQWREQPVSLKEYQMLYEVIDNDQSIGNPSEDIANQFRTGYAATMSILTHSEKDSSTHSFQQIQFSSLGDYYRVELRQESQKSEQWAYFRHPAIFEKLIAIVSESSVKEL